MDGPPENDYCSICHEEFNIPCQANCSHWFCGNCIMRVWNHGSTLQPCKCPICRRSITLLIPSKSSSGEHNNLEVRVVLEEVGRYNRQFGGGSHSLVQRLRDMPFLLRRLIRELADPQRRLHFVFSARVICSSVISLLYVLSPIDIIPEGILGVIGFLDDILVALFFFLHIAAMYRAALVNRHGGN